MALQKQEPVKRGSGLVWVVAIVGEIDASWDEVLIEVMSIRAGLV